METILWIGIGLVLVLAAIFFGAAPFLLFDYAATRRLPQTPSSEEDMQGTKWEKYGAETIRIEAQTYARKLYEDHGFRQDGEEFLEDDIPHIPMIWHAPKD